MSFLPNNTRRTTVLPSRARTEMIQMRTRNGTGDMMSSQGLKLSGAGLHVMEVELVQCSLKKVG